MNQCTEGKCRRYFAHGDEEVRVWGTHVRTRSDHRLQTKEGEILDIDRLVCY